MKSISLFLLLLFFSNASFSQVKGMKAADRWMESRFYEKAAKKLSQIDRRGELDEIGIAKLAKCYYLNHQYEKSCEQYDRMIKHPAASSEDLFRYVHCLKRQQRYSEADKWMEVFLKRNRTDLRALQFKENKNYLYSLLRQDIYYEVYDQKSNSRAADLGGYPKGESFDLFFITSRKTSSIKHFSWENTQKPAYDLFKGTQGPRFQLVVPRVFDKKLNRRYEYGPLCFSKDLKTVFFTRRERFGQRFKSGLLNDLPTWKICSARINKEGKWVDIQELPFCSKQFSTGHPTLSPNEDKLYFASDRMGGYGQSDIYQVDLTKVDSSWQYGEPVNLGPTINTESHEMFPWVNEEGQMFFSSDGKQGFGGFDIYAAFPNPEDGFRSFMNLGEPINSSKDDYAFIPKRDGYSGYFTSNRDNGKGGDDIYGFEQLKPLQKLFQIKGVVKDANTENVLKNGIVYLYDEYDLEITRDTTDKKGQYLFNVEMDRPYTIRITQKGYFDTVIVFSPLGSVPPFGECYENADLVLNPEVTFSLHVKDKQTRNEIEGALVHIIDNEIGQEVYLLNTDEHGKILKKVTDNTFGDCLDYRVMIEKNGYLAKTFQMKHCIDSYGNIAFNDFDDLKLIPKNKDLELTEMLGIENIDVNEISNELKPEIRKELLKIAELLNVNPGLKVEIEVHLDCTLDRIQARRESERKAKMLADFIRLNAYSPSQLKYKGYGNQNPKIECDCDARDENPCSESELKQNQRVEIRMIN